MYLNLAGLTMLAATATLMLIAPPYPSERRTPRANNRLPAGDEGLINTFVVNDDGTLGEHRLIDATGQGPFGFTFNRESALLTTEQFDGPFGPGRGAAAGYLVNPNGTLSPSSGSVGS